MSQVLEDYKTTLVRISSEDKSSGSQSNSNFKVDLPSDGGKIDNIVTAQVKYISCPNVFPNVPSYPNNSVPPIPTNQIAIENGIATTFVILITSGQYTISQLITQMTTQINAVIAPDTVIITLNSLNQLVFTFSANYSFVYSGTGMANIIGLTGNTTLGLVNTMQSIPNLIGETEIYVISEAIAQNFLVESTGSFSVVDVLPLDKPYGQMCYSNYNDSIAHEIKYIPYDSRRTYRT